jgi:hypothetical protein
MKRFIYCMAIFAMLLFAVACDNASTSSNDVAMVQDVQLEEIQPRSN